MVIKTKFPGFHFTMKKLFWGFLVVAVVLTVVIAIFPNNDSVPILYEQSEPFNDGWTLENTGEDITLPYMHSSKKNDVVVISKVLPDVFQQSNPTLSFHTSLQSVTVKVGDTVLYEYCKEPDAYFEVQPPPAWHVIRLTPGMAGKTLRILYSSPINSYAGVLNEIQIGTKIATVTTFVTGRFLSIALCLIIFSFGLFAIVICLFAHNKIADLNKLLYLGIASVLIAVWSACETKAMQIFTGNVQLIMFATFLSIMLVPIPLLLFFREGFTGWIRKLYNGFIGAFSLYFAVIVLLQTVNIVYFNTFFPLFLLLVGVMLILLFSTLISAYVKNKTVQTRLPVLAVFFLMLFSMVDMYRYFFENLALTSYSDTALFVRVGILFMLFVLGFSSIKQILVYYSESMKAEVYKTLSQTDSMSGLKNRAYLTEVYPSVFQEAVDGNQPFSVIMVDIDNFKDYNDHYGHRAGDDVIRAVARVLQTKAESLSGSAIRYGGEEFLVVLPNIEVSAAVLTAQKIKEGIEALKIAHAYNTASSYITVSQGVYSAVPSPRESLDHVIDCSDQAMYRVKKDTKNGYAVYQNASLG